MKEFVSKIMGIIFVFFILITLCPHASFADNLALTGIVRSIDSSNGIMSVDIVSESCGGLRAFRIPDYIQGDLESVIGKKIQFMIDGSKCERGKIYNMIFGVQP